MKDLSDFVHGIEDCIKLGQSKIGMSESYYYGFSIQYNWECNNAR